MNNTARKFNDPVVLSLIESKNTDLLASLAFRNTDDIISAIGYWEKRLNNASISEKQLIEIEISRLESILTKKTELSMDLYGVEVSTISEKEPARMQKTEESEISEKESKVVSLFDGKELQDKPNLKDLSLSVRKVLKEKGYEEAKALATQYLSTGNYTPKKEGQVVENWTEKRINSWLKDLKALIEEETVPKKGWEEAKKDFTEQQLKELLKKFKLPFNEDIKEFGTTKNTLEEETKAFDEFAAVYEQLHTSNSEDIEVAELLLQGFFANRGYTADQIQKWIEYITEETTEKNVHYDHFLVLGVPGQPLPPAGGLISSSITYEDLRSAIKEKIQNKAQKDEIVKHFRRKISGKYLKNNNGVEYKMFSDLHADDLINKLIDAAPEEKEISEKKEDLQEPEVSKITRKDIEQICLTLIKNGGIIDDILLNSEIKDLVGKKISALDTKGGVTNHTEDSLKNYLLPIFNETKKKYEETLTSYPLNQFLRMIEVSYTSGISAADCLKNNISLLKKSDDTFLSLKGKKDDGSHNIIKFEKDSDVLTYINEVYAIQKKLEEKDQEPLKEESKKETKDYEIESINEIREKGLEKIKSGSTFDDIFEWMKKNILNRKLKETKEGGEIKDEKVVKVMAEGIFRDQFQKKEESKKFDKEKFEKEAETLLQAENATIALVAKNLKEKCNQDNVVAHLSEIFAVVKSAAKKVKPELLSDKTENKTEATIKKVSEAEIFVEEKVSVKDPDNFEVAKKFTTLDELYNFCLEFKEKEEWQKGLSFAIEIIELGNIESTKSWTKEMIVTWFNKNIMKDNTEDIEVIEVESIEEEKTNKNYDFNKIQNAVDKK